MDPLERWWLWPTILFVVPLLVGLVYNFRFKHKYGISQHVVLGLLVSVCWLAALILILLLATGLAVTRVQVRHQWNTSAGIRRHLVEVARHAPLEVCFGPFLANRDRLKEAGIPFVEVPSSRASTMQAFPYSEARYAPAGAPRNGSSSAWHKTSSGR